MLIKSTSEKAEGWWFECAASCSHAWWIMQKWRPFPWCYKNLEPISHPECQLCLLILTISWKEGLGFHYLLLFQWANWPAQTLAFRPDKTGREQCLLSSIFISYSTHSGEKKADFPMAMSSLLSKKLIFHGLTALRGGWIANTLLLLCHGQDWEITASGKEPATTACLPNCSHPTSTLPK